MKPTSIGTSVKSIHRFYLTYEELKPNCKTLEELKKTWILSYLWGIETQRRWSKKHDVYWILSYLWGIETWYWDNTGIRWSKDFILPMRNWNNNKEYKFKFNSKWILSYLWGIETVEPEWFRQRTITILSYLWGIETLLLLKNYSYHSPGFYLTYEELKQFHTPIFAVPLWDFILPMRNWNGVSNVGKSTAKDWILSYLWGIETHFLKINLMR